MIGLDYLYAQSKAQLADLPGPKPPTDPEGLNQAVEIGNDDALKDDVLVEEQIDEDRTLPSSLEVRSKPLFNIGGLGLLFT